MVTKLGDENSASGFVENFTEVMRLRKGLAKSNQKSLKNNGVVHDHSMNHTTKQ